MSEEVWIVAARRTPIGRFGGSLAGRTAVELGVAAVKAVLKDVPEARVDYLVLGLARQAGCGPNPARQVAVGSGLPVSVPAHTVNQACASGMAAIAQAADRIRLGQSRFVVAAGAESMSRVPYMLDEVRFGQRMGHRTLLDGMYRDGLHCPMADMIMGETVEQVAREFGISRQEQDEFAARSQNRYEAAQARGCWEDERVPLDELALDEHARAGVTPESLARLPAVFAREGTISAGNSSGITDGASALVLGTGEACRQAGLQPLASLEGTTVAALEPARMALGPVPAVRAYLERHRLRLDDFDLIEANEAFAAQVLACDRELGFPSDRLNVNGGSIAMGHPIGCTGNRIVVTLLHEMKRRGARRGLATLCVSGGQGMALGLTRGGSV